ncbi:MAG TPA: chalcone isomerase family protein, partial [Steroidobacteraceae bacterium]|nr:chalcone isomerase family protein [Steroidobacteraceae bacterium]
MKAAAVLMGLLLTTSGMSAAQAKICHSIEFPEHLQVRGSELTLNGLGMRKATFLKVNVYVAALYVTHPSHDPQPLMEPNSTAELILRFVRNVGVDDLRKAWGEGFEKAAKGQLPALEARIATLSGWMSDMKKGQTLAFVRLPGGGVEVIVDGANSGTIHG